MYRNFFYLLVLFVMFVPQSVEASSSSQIDFTITHEINIINEIGSTELEVEPLIISNNSACDLNVETINVEMVDAWSLLPKDSNFEELPLNSKVISFYLSSGEDLYKDVIEPFAIEKCESKNINLIGKTSKKTTNSNKTHVANIVIEITPVYECKTVYYEDGTLIINEITWDRDKNITEHGRVMKEYEPLGTENKYVFLSSTGAPWYSNRRNIKRIQVGSPIKPTQMKYWFYGFTALEYADLSNVNTSKCTNMSMAFYNAGSSVSEVFSLEGLNAWDVSMVTDFSGMFNNCGSKAKSWNIGDLSGWRPKSAENLNNMFFMAGNKSKTWYIGDLSEWDVSSVKSFLGTFNQSGEYSESFVLGNLQNWNTSKVENMSKMFYNSGHDATQWYIGDISGWDVSKVTDFSSMFYNAAYKCQDVSIGYLNWNLDSATTASSMFGEFAAGTIGLNLGEIYFKKDCSIDSIMKNCANTKIIIRFASVCSVYDSCFESAAGGTGGDIRLVGDNSSVIKWLENIVGLYGATGKTSKGNVWI